MSTTKPIKKYVIVECPSSTYLSDSSMKTIQFLFYYTALHKFFSCCTFQIIEVFEQEVRLKYMKKKGKFFEWPTKEDKSVELKEAICQHLNPPELHEAISNQRKQYYVFDPEPKLD